ncbi:hypothetical protein KKF81_05175 [Candidatus Micrarchaeota archaeon]|nr:hypothetical protein [Candidatus Micrarchaeota archaeon]
MEELEEKMNSLVEYRNALRGTDKEIFDRLVHYAKGHVMACGKASNLTILESMLLAIVIEQQKKIEMIGVHA